MCCLDCLRHCWDTWCFVCLLHRAVDSSQCKRQVSFWASVEHLWPHIVTWKSVKFPFQPLELFPHDVSIFQGDNAPIYTNKSQSYFRHVGPTSKCRGQKFEAALKTKDGLIPPGHCLCHTVNPRYIQLIHRYKTFSLNTSLCYIACRWYVQCMSKWC